MTRVEQGRFYVGAGGTCPQIHLLPPIQKLADRSDVIFEVPKYSKTQIFKGFPLNPAGAVYSAPADPLTDEKGLADPCQEPHPTPTLGPSALVSTGLMV